MQQRFLDMIATIATVGECMKFKLKKATTVDLVLETVEINTIEDLRNLSFRFPDERCELDSTPLIVDFVNMINEPDPVITVYDGYIE